MSRYGPSSGSGAVAIMDLEEASARLALSTGDYTVWRLIPGGLRAGEAWGSAAAAAGLGLHARGARQPMILRVPL